MTIWGVVKVTAVRRLVTRYRQMHEFIRVHLQRLNGAFGLRLPIRPPIRARFDHSGRQIPRRWRPPFRQHVFLDFGADPFVQFAGDRRRRQDAARQFRRLQRPQGGAHDVGAAAKPIKSCSAI